MLINHMYIISTNYRKFQAAFPIRESIATQALSSLPLEGSRTGENIVSSGWETEKVGKKYKERGKKR